MLGQAIVLIHVLPESPGYRRGERRRERRLPRISSMAAIQDARYASSMQLWLNAKFEKLSFGNCFEIGVQRDCDLFCKPNNPCGSNNRPEQISPRLLAADLKREAEGLAQFL